MNSRTIIGGLLVFGASIGIGWNETAQAESPRSKHPTCVQSHQPPVVGCRPTSTASETRSFKLADGEPISLKKVFTNLPGDQKAIWAAPFHLRLGDAPWVVPIAGATGLLVARDQNIMLREHSNLTAIHRSDNIANGSTIALAGVPAMMYVWGSLNGGGRSRETGLLTGRL